MGTHRWDPERYLTYADERGRPFLDLLARVGARAPATVVDLGCGPGHLDPLLVERWPQAEVLGVDASPEMIARAEREAAPDTTPETTAGTTAGTTALRFEEGDLRTWRPPAPVDVLVSNATLQWVPGHLDLLPGLLGHLAPAGWFAFSVPGNFEEPSHALRRELEADPRYAAYLHGVAHPAAHGPEAYLAALLDLGCTVDAWETTYLHLLTGEDPVFAWVAGTGARPTLQALPESLRDEFEGEYRALLREAYPPGPHGTVFGFRRVFAVAHKQEEER